MPAFAYQAVDAAGTKRRGVVEASSLAAARRILRDQRLLPVSVDIAREPGAGGGRIRLPIRRGRIGRRALATVTRQIATLVGSNIAIEESLRLAADQADGAAVRTLLLDVRAAILDGRSFADALGRRADTFPEFYRASIAAGEHSGRLSDVLQHLADFVEARERNQQKVMLALLYPALLALVSLGMITLLMIYVVPDIVRVFVSRGADLPFLTRALIALSAGVQAYGVYVLIAALLLFLFARHWLAQPGNRLRFDAFLTRTPPFARFSRQHNAARFAASLATLVQSSVPLVDAIRAAAAVTPNRHMRERTFAIAARVREGASLQAAMHESGVFPSMLIAIVASGESGGRLGPALGRAAGELDRELEVLTQTVVGLVEPGVLLLMGGMVLLLVLAILLPIINLNNLVTM